MDQSRHDKAVSILGCGWLGLPLALSLHSSGWRVKGSTTSDDKLAALRDQGIQPFLIDLYKPNQQQELQTFLESDVLIINYPPGIRGGRGELFAASVQHLAEAVQQSPVAKVIFISSTSVYPNTNGKVTEELNQPPESASGQALLAAERVFLTLKGKEVTVLRMAGLIGYDRQPGRFLAGKKGLGNGKEAVNLIHRDDCIGIIERVMTSGSGGHIFNCCSDTHPTKADFYIRAAQKLGLEPPEFDTPTGTAFKLVGNEKIRESFGYTFRYSDLMLFDWP